MLNFHKAIIASSILAAISLPSFGNNQEDERYIIKYKANAKSKIEQQIKNNQGQIKRDLKNKRMLIRHK